MRPRANGVTVPVRVFSLPTDTGVADEVWMVLEAGDELRFRSPVQFTLNFWISGAEVDA
jgi:hypothetical protein